MIKVKDLRTGKIYEYAGIDDVITTYSPMFEYGFAKQSIVGDIVRMANILSSYGYCLYVDDERQMNAAQLIENIVNELGVAQDFLNETIESRDVHNEITDLISDIDSSLDQFNDIEKDVYKALKEIKL